MLSKLEALVGKRLAQNMGPLSDEFVAVESVEALAREEGYEQVRVMSPGMFGDCAFRPERVSVYTNERGVIERLIAG